MRFTLSAIVVCLMLVGFGPAQEKDKEKEARRKGEDEIKVVKLDRKDVIAYEKEIEQIFVNKCFACHSGNLKEGKFDVSSYDAMMRGGKGGPVVIPGKSAESRLAKLCQKVTKPYMPPRSEEPLTPEELAVLKLWIDQGAKAPTGTRVAPPVVLKSPTVSPVMGVAIIADKSQVAGTRGNQIHVYDATGKHTRTLVDEKLVGHDKKPVKAAHLSLVESLAYSPDGKLLASGSYKEVKLWDAKSGELKHTLTGFAERVVALGFSSDSKQLACGGGAPTQEGEIKIVNVADAKVTLTITNNIHSDTVFGVAFSPDDKMLASCGADKFVKVYELPSGKFLKSFEGHTHHVLGVGFSGDGKLLASGGADNVVKIWSYETGEQVRTIANAHTKQVTGLSFAGKSQNFVTVAGDAQVRLWTTAGNNTRNFTASSDYNYSVSVSPDASLVAAGGQDGVVRIFNGTNGQLIKEALPPGVEKVEKKEPMKDKKKDKK